MARVYIFKGQSNSKGRAPNVDISAPLGAAMPNVQMWQGSSFGSFDVGVNQNFPSTTTNHGVLPAFLYNEQIRTGEIIYAINYAVDGTMLNDDGTSDCWYPSRTGDLLDKAISTINNALAHMWITLGIRQFDFIHIWAQGENDTLAAIDANAYGTNLPNLIAKVEANLSGTALTSSHKRWIFQKISTGTNYDSTRRATVNGVFDTVAAGDTSNKAAYDTTGKELQVDLRHFTAAGYKGIGEEMITNIMQANGW